MIFYHATFANRASSIVQDGLVSTAKKAGWRNVFGGKLAQRRLYAWTREESAILWCGKMQWEFGPAVKKPTPRVVVIAFEDDEAAWEEDEQIIQHPGAVRSRMGHAVHTDNLRSVKHILPFHIQDAIRARNARYLTQDAGHGTLVVPVETGERGERP